MWVRALCRLGRVGGVGLALLCLWPAARALAEPKILLLTTPGDALRPGFSQALQIQLARAASVEIGGTLASDKLPSRVREASRLAHERQAVLAVWVEASDPADPEPELVLYVVGERDGRALVEVLRLRSADDPSADRSLALKVGEVLDTLAGADSSWSQPFAPVLLRHETPAPLGLRAHAGALLLPTRGTAQLPWGLFASAGPELRLGQQRFVAQLGLRWLPAYTAERAAGSVSVAELAPTLELGVQHELQRLLLLGVWLAPSLRIVHADGRTPLGARGAHNDVTAAALAQAGAELRLTQQLGVALALGVELLAAPRRYTINAQSVLSSGSVRPAGSLALVLRL